ncbi:Asp23/Gls24 family envelope stress response protein [Streptomyces sp. NPDC048441]|uniref:Asp23/Gls24 family envelope stress response protein n=1 Tax=Streptomyces sp. NPDC048441 TaxID=3365552 RepID=UPI0037237801
MAMNEGDHSATSAHAGERDDELLACGRELSQVWERWEAGERDAHADGCPHCADALTALRSLGEVVAEARRSEPPEQDPDSAGLTSRIMDVVRLELRPGRTLPLGEAEDDVWIVEAAAARAFRAAAETVPGVRAGSCKVETDPPGTPRGPARVRIEVQVPLSWDLPEAAELVRRKVRDAADAELGMRVVSIDVRIADIIDDGEEGPQ